MGSKDSRIGFRHPGGSGSANVNFADGHVGSIRGTVFPRGDSREDNLGGDATLYANPERYFGLE